MVVEMETKDTPQGIVGFRFAQALLRGDYEAARTALSEEVKLEYAGPNLKETFEGMMEITYAAFDDQPQIEVLDNAVLADPSRAEEGFVYVGIWSEALILRVQPLDGEYLITELEFGRP